jgi:hypothetical protein
MRGPLASKVLNQLLLATDWGELDYLVVDMPPGTGDIQLTLSQTAALTGAVIVTTPHVLSLVDAAKGVELFRTVNIPTLAIVENMSFFKCEHNSVYYPFGKGGRKKLIQSLREQKTVTNIEEITEDIEKVPYFALPLCMEGAGMKMTKTNESEKNNNGNDNKKPLGDKEEADDDQMELLSSPLVVSFPESESAKVYHSLSDAIINQVFQLQINAQYVRKKFNFILLSFVVWLLSNPLPLPSLSLSLPLFLFSPSFSPQTRFRLFLSIRKTMEFVSGILQSVKRRSIPFLPMN